MTPDAPSRALYWRRALQLEPLPVESGWWAPRSRSELAVTEGEDTLAAHNSIFYLLDAERRPATPDERRPLARFGGFGAVALGLFPDPVTGRYKDRGWQELGDELQSLLSPADYDSAKRSTFSAFCPDAMA